MILKNQMLKNDPKQSVLSLVLTVSRDEDLTFLSRFGRVFRTPSFRTKSSGQRSFSYQDPAIWKQLSVSVRHSTSVGSFEFSFKTFLFLKTFSSVPLP